MYRTDSGSFHRYTGIDGIGWVTTRSPTFVEGLLSRPATNDADEIAELADLLASHGPGGTRPIIVLPEPLAAGLRDAFAATGLASMADDSGLEVAALNGMPGVLSARWSGSHGDDEGNTTLLLAQLRDVPDERRGAAFVSACALVSSMKLLKLAMNGTQERWKHREASLAPLPKELAKELAD